MLRDLTFNRLVMSENTDRKTIDHETINRETIDLTNNIRKRKTLRSELFTKELFEERDLPPEHKNAKTHQEVKCLNCL